MTNWSKKIISRFIMPVFVIGSLFYVSFYLDMIKKEKEHSLEIIEKNAELLSRTLGILINESYGRENLDYLYFLNSISLDKHIINLSVKDNNGNLIFQKKEGVTSPRGFFESISYYFFENDTINSSKNIYARSNRSNLTSDGSYILVGRIEILSVAYIPLSRVIKDCSIGYAFFLSMFFLFLVSVIYFDFKINKFINSLISELNHETPKSSRVFLGGNREIKKLVYKIVDNINKYKSIISKDIKYYQNTITKLNKNIDELHIKIDKSTMIRKEYLKTFNTISHDIKSPLHVMKTFSSKLKENILSKSDYRYLNAIDLSIIEIEALSKRISDDYLISSEELVNKNIPLDIFDSICSKVNNYREKAIEKGVDMIYLTPSASMTNYITVNWSVLSRTLNNLLDNAIKYSESGTIVVRILIENSNLKISIKDQGIGISSNHISKIFDSYYQVKEQPENIGYGLGLSIVKKNIESLNGNINVVSKEGIGSLFEVSVPINVISKFSPKQIKIREIAKNSEISLSLINDETELTHGIYNQLVIFGFNVKKVIINQDSITDSILIGVDLSIYEDKSFINKFKHSLSIEKDDKINITGINSVISITTTIYDLSEKIISIYENLKLTRIGGQKTEIESLESTVSSPIGNILNDLSKETQGPLFGYKILLIDDHNGCSIVTSTMLSELGGSVIEQQEYNKVAEQINSFSFDFIVTDFNLKNFNGLDVYKMANSSIRNHDTPIICHSGDETIKSRNGVSNVFSTILSKPSSKENWITAISRIKRKDRAIRSVTKKNQ